MNSPSKPKYPQNVAGEKFYAYGRRRVRLILGHPYLAVLGLLLTLVTFGTGGYMVIEGWEPLDALYMTTITLTTIGYGETQPLSTAGRVFTIGLIVIGVIIASYTVTTTIELFTSNDFLAQLRTRRRRRALEKFENHVIICGYGRMGRSLTNELRIRGSTVIVIDPTEEAIEICRQRGIPAIQGTASDDRVLLEAGLKRANSLVAATGSDAENVFIVLTAKSIRSDLQIFARSNAESSIPKLESAGANKVIIPYAIAGRRIAHMLTHPNVTNFLDGILEIDDQQMRLEEFIIGQNSPLADKTLKEAKLNVVVLAVDHPGQTVFTHPSADTKLLPGTAIIVMGLDEELHKLEKLVKG